MNKLLSVLIFVILSASIFFTVKDVLLAQNGKIGTLESLTDVKTPPLLEGTVNCFDYYHFQSVQTSLGISDYNVKSGSTAQISGTISNENDYPIVSGTLYIKVMREAIVGRGPNGPDVVDQFIAKDGIIIPAKGSVPVSFSWRAPAYLLSGTYRMVSFFVVDSKFNLLGLSFTDDIIGNIFEFHVLGETTNIQFDKAGVTINEATYYFATFPPRVEKKDNAVVSVSIDNSTEVSQTVKVIWDLYKWDSINPNNFIRSVSQDIFVKAGSSTRVQTTVNESDEAVYYLVATLVYKDSKSILGIRFVRPEIDNTRLNFPSINQFPIKKDATTTIFTCLHNSGPSDYVPNGKVLLQITDTKGRKVSEYMYKGDVTTAMMAIKYDFVAKSNLDHFFLTATLWQAEKIVDQSKVEYDCQKIDPALCFAKGYSALSVLLAVATAIFIALLILISIVYILKRRWPKR